MKQGPTSHTGAASHRVCVHKNTGRVSSVSQVKVLFSLALAAFLSKESDSEKIAGEEGGGP